MQGPGTGPVSLQVLLGPRDKGLWACQLFLSLWFCNNFILFFVSILTQVDGIFSSNQGPLVLFIY